MSLTLRQIEELPLKERRQLGAGINYFNSKLYIAHKRRKRTMTAIMEIENDSTASSTNALAGR